MPAIPSALAQRLRDTLAQHPALDSDRALRALFVDERLADQTDLANALHATLLTLAAETQAFDLMALLGSENNGYRYASAIVERTPGEMWFGTNAGVVQYDGENW